MRAQSGRRTQPSPTPTPVRPRRVPASANDQPGQPATPDAPSTTGGQRPTQAPQPDPSAQPSADAGGAPVEVDEDEVYRVDSNLVPVSANVSDAAGRAVLDLKVEDFELRVDGQPRPISDLSFSETPVRLALLFDNSSSVRPTRALEKQAAVRFLRTVLRPATDQAALFSISTYPSLDQPLTADIAKLARTVENYGDVEGSTALFDTIIAAAEYLRPMPGRKVIVIVSDGVETTSQISEFGEVLRRALASDCQVFAIQTGLSDNANLRDLLAERRMQDLTASTGGSVYTPKVAADLDAAFAHISSDLAQQYVLSYYPTEDGRDGRFRAISLRVKTRANTRVRARRGYYPRRRSDLSALPPNFVVDTNRAANEATPESVVRTQAADAQSPARTIDLANSSTTAAPVVARGALHGSKNLDPDAGDAAGERETAASTRPSIRLGNFNTTPARDEPKKSPADARADTKSPSPETNAQPAQRDDTATAESTGAAKAEPSPRPAGAEATRPAPPQVQSSAKPSSRQPDGASRSTQSQSAGSQPAESQGGGRAAKPPISGGVLNGRAVSLPRPPYPETARRARSAGTVSVEVTIDEGGKVIAARAVSGPALLRAAAVSAARLARFSPTLISGRPVQVTGIINYNFSL